jgi:hypothetical protein
MLRCALRSRYIPLVVGAEGPFAWLAEAVAILRSLTFKYLALS